MKIRTISEELYRIYGTKVLKLSLSSGCTCPNRDGTVGYGGCTFCSEGGSGEFASPFLPVGQQIALAKRLVDGKFPKSIPPDEYRYIAYYQSFSNTYGDTGFLQALYEKTLSFPEIVGLSIGTRPDCLEGEKIRMLSSLNRRGNVFVELGLQTIHEKSALRIHRGYKLPVFEDAYFRLKWEGIAVVVHVILGLPGESREDMLDTVRYLASLTPPPDGIKIHMLCILKGTQLEREYLADPFPLPDLDEYISLVISCLKLLPPETVIHRLTGDPPRALLRAPQWCLDKKKVLNSLNRRIQETP